MVVLALIEGCSSDSTAPSSPASSDSGRESSPGSEGGSSSGGQVDGGYGSWGVTCSNPINEPGSGGDGGVDGGGKGGAAEGARWTAAASIPSAWGSTILCANVGRQNKCTKSCTYPGGGGAKPDPTDCPSPPTNGDCTPRGFCQ